VESKKWKDKSRLRVFQGSLLMMLQRAVRKGISRLSFDDVTARGQEGYFKALF
jgi:hypothetical protein